MAVQPISFQVLSPQQANPTLYGMQAGSGLVSDALKDRLMNAQNQQLQIQNQYLPYSQQADIGSKMMQTQMMPLQTYAAYLNGAGRYGMANQGLIKNLSTILGSPLGLQMLKDNPQLASQFNSITQNLGTTGAAVSGMMPGNMAGGMAGAPGMPTNPLGNLPPSLFPALHNMFQQPQQNDDQGQQPQQNSSMPPQPLPLSGQQIVRLKQLAPGGNPDGVAPTPTQPPPQQPNVVNDLQNTAAQELLKKTTDGGARGKSILATNLDKTMQNINVNDLAQGAGATGEAWRLAQGLLSHMRLPGAQSGMESQNYDNFQKAQLGAETLAHQVRQFYQDSIQPSMMEQLNNLTNPSWAAGNPNQFKNLVGNFYNILNSEKNTYRDALQNPGTYTGKNQGAPASNNATAQPSANNQSFYGYQPAEINAYAAKYKMSPQQVMAKIHQAMSKNQGMGS